MKNIPYYNNFQKREKKLSLWKFKNKIILNLKFKTLLFFNISNFPSGCFRNSKNAFKSKREKFGYSLKIEYSEYWGKKWKKIYSLHWERTQDL